jgi:hypothetical protein
MGKGPILKTIDSLVKGDFAGAVSVDVLVQAVRLGKGYVWDDRFEDGEQLSKTVRQVLGIQLGFCSNLVFIDSAIMV